MRITVASGLAGTASLIAGIVVPMIVPQIEPWVGYSLLAVAGIMFLVALALWLSGWARKPDDVQSNSASGDRAVAVGGDNHAPIKTGDTNQNFGANLGHIGSVHQHGPVPFEMTEALMTDVANQLGEAHPISVYAVGGKKSQQAVALLAAFLRSKGFAIEMNSIGILSPPLDQPIELRAGGVYVGL